MYLRAPDRTCSRCSAMVCSVTWGTSLTTVGSGSGASGLYSAARSATLAGTRSLTFWACWPAFLPMRFRSFLIILFAVVTALLVLAGERPLRGVNAQIPQYVHHLFLDLSRPVHIVDHQITNIGLYDYCTKVKQRFLQAGYLVVDHLHLFQA